MERLLTEPKGQKPRQSCGRRSVQADGGYVDASDLVVQRQVTFHRRIPSGVTY